MPTRRPPACTSPRSAARSRPGRTRWSCSTAPAGTAPATSPSPGTSPCCRSRPTRPSRTRSRTSGSTCARTSSAIASGRATTPSSRPAARRGTGSWRRPTGSPRSPAASGPKRSPTRAVSITPVKKSPRPADPAGREPAGLGARLRRRGLVPAPGAAGAARLDGGRAPAPRPARRRPHRPQGLGVLRPVAAGARADAAALRRRAAGQPGDLRLPRLGRRAPRGRRRSGPGAGLGQRLLAHQPRGAGLDPGAQSRGQAGRPRLPPPDLPVAEQEPVAQPDRAQVAARQTRGGRAGTQAHRQRAQAAALRPLSMPAPAATRTTGPLILHEGARGGARKTLIVALARKLLIALWRLVTTGEAPEGLVLRPAG